MTPKTENIIDKPFEFSKIHDNDMRKFECWGSVEIVDNQGDLIPIEELQRIMDIWVDRGAPIMFNHTNQHVGKGLNWRRADKNGTPGVLITGKIFKHYVEDDTIWDGIKDGTLEGLSFGGKSYSKERDSIGNIIRRQITGHEFSVVKKCANQEATFTEVNTMAKGEKEIKKEEDPIMEETPQDNS